MSADRLHRTTEDDAVELRGFIRRYVEDSGSKGAVIGLSGGIDSAVVVKLAVDALGPENVHAIFMPSAVTPEADYECVERLAKGWGINLETIGIQPAADAFASLLGGELTPLERGNITARCRMTVLYARAKSLNCIVLGTSNQSEYMMGYFTKYGDGGSDAAPIVGLYKTNVRHLARIIGVPEEIISKPPSAGLWEGQTDEGEMGITYESLDHVLHAIENGWTDAEISADVGVDVAQVAEIRARVKAMVHKRVPAARPGKTY